MGERKYYRKYLGTTLSDLQLWATYKGGSEKDGEKNCRTMQTNVQYKWTNKLQKGDTLCAPVWSPHMAQNLEITSYEREITMVDRKGILRVARAFKTARTNALSVITGVMPIYLLADGGNRLYNGREENSDHI